MNQYITIDVYDSIEIDLLKEIWNSVECIIKREQVDDRIIVLLEHNGEEQKVNISYKNITVDKICNTKNKYSLKIFILNKGDGTFLMTKDF